MKALTVRQPWAWAIAFAAKDIENRVRRTHYRGPVAIHAGLSRSGLHDPLPRGVSRPDREELVFGAIIAVAELIDCREFVRSKWYAPDHFAWLLANVQPLERPIACKGALNLWDLPPDVERRLRRQVRIGGGR